MNKNFDKKVRKFNKSHKRKKIWHRIVSFLSAVVVFCTTYLLILPAITLDRNEYSDNKLALAAEKEGNQASARKGNFNSKNYNTSRND